MALSSFYSFANSPDPVLPYIHTSSSGEYLTACPYFPYAHYASWGLHFPKPPGIFSFLHLLLSICSSCWHFFFLDFLIAYSLRPWNFSVGLLEMVGHKAVRILECLAARFQVQTSARMATSGTFFLFLQYPRIQSEVYTELTCTSYERAYNLEWSGVEQSMPVRSKTLSRWLVHSCQHSHRRLFFLQNFTHNT